MNKSSYSYGKLIIAKRNNPNLNHGKNDINLSYCNQMNSNYMKDEKAIKTLAYKYMKPIANNIRLRFIIDYKKLKTSNLVISNNTSKESTVQMSSNTSI